MKRLKTTICRALGFALALACLLIPPQSRGENDPRLYAVELTATVEAQPLRIRLNWPGDPNARSYVVSRKLPNESQWVELARLNGGATSFVDTDVLAGAAFEYRVAKPSSRGFTGFGYILAGTQAPLVEDRGKIILITDITYAGDLAPELARLQQDLVGDGWKVIRRNVSRSARVSSIKNLIKTEYDADPANFKAVFLFGHVPVPRSGNLMPDGHENHQGAWAADTYYADMDGIWTDATVDTIAAERDDNHNVPGDGRFDQSEIPSDLELAVGRIDFANMTCFANKTPARSELDLLRQYLDKDHAFRHAQFTILRRGLIADGFGEAGGEAYAANGWRNFAPMFSAANNIKIGPNSYFPTLIGTAFLCAYACGGGGYSHCDGIGSSDDFALYDVQTVFTFYFGSYFGDWDNESNFLRASLGSGFVLTASWAGNPHAFNHRMALGETIGQSSQLTQNNGLSGYNPINDGARQVHTALLGDPTLRLHPVSPPLNVTATTGSQTTLSWIESSDTAVVGYHVYRAPNANGPFTRLTTLPIATTTFTDTAPATNAIYMIRAIKLEATPSGTYYNASQGAFNPNTISFPAPEPGPAAASRFVEADTLTGGDWHSVYGGDGTMIAGVPATIPAYATVTPQLASEWVWSTDPDRASAPMLPDSTNRIASCWFSANSLTFDLSISDGALHRVSAYFLDWDFSGRQQRVELIDIASGAILDSRTLTNFTSGIYLVWEITGDVLIRVTPLVGNSIINALFFDDIPPPPPPTTARLVRTDVGTVGNWPTIYGADGYWLAGTPPNLPTYATVNALSPQWIWTTQPNRIAAPRIPGDTTNRIAACWYSATQLGFDIRINDGQPHRVAVYFLDWSVSGRQQRVDLIDLETGAILDTRSVTNFAYGIHLVWEITGKVGIRATPSNVNAVISALFFDPAPPKPQTSARFLTSDATTRGNWKSVYGSDGGWVVGTNSFLPSYANVAALSPQWIWMTNPGASLSAPYLPGATTNRIAACWYSASELGLDITMIDAKPHRLTAYFLDWSASGRQQRVDLIDLNTAAVLDSRTLTNFSKGVYLSWEVTGQIGLRATPANVNAVVSALFFDLAP